MEHILDEISHVYCFWKRARISFEHSTFFRKKKQFWTFWELVSIITIWDAFQSFFWIFAFLKKFQRFFRKKPNAKRCENSWAKTQFETDCTSNLANYSFLTENSSFLIRKTPLLFPRKSKVWKFWEIWAKIPFETHSIKILLISAIFKNDQQFFEITHLGSRKSQAVERFPFSRALRVFERLSKEKYPCLAFLETFKCFSEKKTSLFRKTQRLNVFRTHEHKWIAKRIRKKTCKFRRLRKFSKHFFFKISIPDAF